MQKFDYKSRLVIDKYSTYPKLKSKSSVDVVTSSFRFIFRRKNFHFKLKTEIQTT